MVLYILRHGIAEDSHPNGDSDRSLTGEGKKKVKGVMEFVKKKIAPSLILSSPYVRAKQTADIAASVLSAGTVQFLESLYPHSDPEDTIIDINALDVDEILLVGHDPHMSDLLSLLVCGSRDVFSLKKSAIAAVEFSGKIEAGRGNLKWLLTPGLVG